MNVPPGNPRRNRGLEGIAMVLMAVSAILFQRAATTSWVDARAADGRRVEVSPIGVIDHGLGTTGTPARECRWWPRLGDAELCEVVPGAAMTQLRRAYPLTVASLWTSVLALFLVALSIPRLPRLVSIAVTAIVPVLAITAIVSLNAGNKALGVLANASMSFARGATGVFTGALLMAIAAGLLLLSSTRKMGNWGQAPK